MISSVPPPPAAEVCPYVAPASKVAWCLDGFAEYERKLEEVVMRAWTDEEVAALAGIASRLGTSPRALVGVMANESGCNPAAHNPGGAVGLIQFEPDILRDLGWTDGTDAFAKLSVLEQLVYVEHYYAPANRKPPLASGGVGPAYVGAFLPALMSHGNEAAFVLCGTHGPFAWAYAANKSFDVDGKGWITVLDLVNAAERAIERSECARGILAALDPTEAAQELAQVAAEPPPLAPNDAPSIMSEES